MDELLSKKLRFQVKEAAALILSGEVVIFPTETFWGLAAAPGNAAGVDKLLELKCRELTAGIPLIISEGAQLLRQCDEEEPGLFSRIGMLSDVFWPGPLSLIVSVKVKKRELFAEGIFGPDHTVACRVSPHPVARELAAACGGWITATSANFKGLPPAASAQSAKAYFPELYIIDILPSGVEDGGHTQPSTLLDIRSSPAKVLRQGAIGIDELKKHLDVVVG